MNKNCDEHCFLDTVVMIFGFLRAFRILKPVVEPVSQSFKSGSGFGQNHRFSDRFRFRLTGRTLDVSDIITINKHSSLFITFQNYPQKLITPLVIRVTWSYTCGFTPKKSHTSVSTVNSLQLSKVWRYPTYSNSYKVF